MYFVYFNDNWPLELTEVGKSLNKLRLIKLLTQDKVIHLFIIVFCGEKGNVIQDLEPLGLWEAARVTLDSKQSRDPGVMWTIKKAGRPTKKDSRGSGKET